MRNMKQYKNRNVKNALVDKVLSYFIEDKEENNYVHGTYFSYLGRFLMLCLGLCTCGTGIGFLLYANLGTDAVSVFSTGMAKVLHISYGSAMMLLQATFAILVFFVNKKYLHIASVMAVFIIGYPADFVHALLQRYLVFSPTLWTNIIFSFLGMLIVSLGVAIYLEAHLGVAPVDAGAEILLHRYPHISYRWFRIASDLCFLLAGLALGGDFGLGTFICAFGIGPVVAFHRKWCNKVYHYFEKSRVRG